MPLHNRIPYTAWWWGGCQPHGLSSWLCIQTTKKSPGRPFRNIAMNLYMCNR